MSFEKIDPYDYNEDFLTRGPLVFRADNFERLFDAVVYEIMESPRFICKPRGSLVKEMLVPTLQLHDPRARLLASKARDAQYGFAVGEFLWYWAGKNDLETMLYYNKRMKDFSDDGKTINSAYGWRTRRALYSREGNTAQQSQWEVVKKTLLDDQDSRRALLLINDPFDQYEAATRGSKDVPCTLSLQFFIRRNRLYLHTNMRSNDAVWGLTYDLFSFTLLQELMMLELRQAGMKDLRLGHYYHTAGSMHIYERHFTMAQAVIDEYVSPGYMAAAPMEPLVLDEMGRLLEYEEELRLGKQTTHDSSRFSGGVRWLAEQLESQRRKRDAERR